MDDCGLSLNLSKLQVYSMEADLKLTLHMMMYSQQILSVFHPLKA